MSPSAAQARRFFLAGEGVARQHPLGQLALRIGVLYVVAQAGEDQVQCGQALLPVDHFVQMISPH